MQNRAQMKESKCAKDILKCANEKRRLKRNKDTHYANYYAILSGNMTVKGNNG